MEAEILRRKPAAMANNEFSRYAHEFRILLHFPDFPFQLFKGLFFCLHRPYTENTIFKPFARKEQDKTTITMPRP